MHLEALCKEHPEYRGRHVLSADKMKRITNGICCAIKMHSTTGDVAAFRHDLRNGVRHYFGDHRQCRLTFCKHTTDTNYVPYTINITVFRPITSIQITSIISS